MDNPLDELASEYWDAPEALDNPPEMFDTLWSK